MNINKLSNIIPAYNEGNTIHRILDKVKAVTLTNNIAKEIIIVNDCSTDSSLTILNSFTDNRIVLISNPVNLGLTKSLNKGLKIARGEYVVRLDADDYCVE